MKHITLTLRHQDHTLELSLSLHQSFYLLLYYFFINNFFIIYKKIFIIKQKSI